MRSNFRGATEDQRFQRLSALVKKYLSNTERILPEDSFREAPRPPSEGIERWRE